MKASRLLLTMWLLSTPIAAEEQAALRAAREGTCIDVYVGQTLFTSYKFAAEQKYPYLYPVNGPASGESVTTETSEPYPHHHSVFFGCDRVNGGNYWQDANERGQIRSEDPEIVQNAGEQVIIKDTCVWKQPGKEPVIRDTRRMVFSAPSAAVRVIDFEIVLDPKVDVRIEKTNHSLFSARMAPGLSVKGGGVLVNAEGLRSEEQTFGVASPWCDYYGERNGLMEGLAIFQHPANRWFPAKWFTRDYGFFSPTPMYWPEGEHTDLPKGETVTLRYRVVVHTGDTAQAGIAQQFAAYAK